jgi:hypothetical protein
MMITRRLFRGLRVMQTRAFTVKGETMAEQPGKLKGVYEGAAPRFVHAPTIVTLIALSNTRACRVLSVCVVGLATSGYVYYQHVSSFLVVTPYR